MTKTTGESAKVKPFDVLQFVADNAGLSTFEAIEKAYNIGMSEQEAVLDTIKDEIKEKFSGCDICEWFDDYDYGENDISEYRSVGDIDLILEIIDKYKRSKNEEE